MKATTSLLLATMALLTPSTAGAQAQPHLVIRSDGGCPSAEAVTAALHAIRADDEWPPLLATVHVAEDRVQILLGQDLRNQREIGAAGDCNDRANAVALVIAIWSGELPARATGAPTLTVATPAPVPSPVTKAPTVTEVGLSTFSSLVGGLAPGAQAEVTRLWPGSRWGARAVAAYQSARSVRVDIGETRYQRVQLGVFLVLQWTHAALFLNGDLGVLGAFTAAQGKGYSQDQSAQGTNAALAIDGRVGFRLGRIRLWSELQGFRWASKETVRVDPLATGPATTATLPAWDARVGLGAGVAFP